MFLVRKDNSLKYFIDALQSNNIAFKGKLKLNLLECNNISWV